MGSFYSCQFCFPVLVFLWSTNSEHCFRFIQPVIRLPLATCIRRSCVAFDGWSSPSRSAAHPPQPGLGWYSDSLASTSFFMLLNKPSIGGFIPKISTVAHALLEPVKPQHLAELDAGVMAAFVRVKHQLLWAVTGFKSNAQRARRKLLVLSTG